MKLSLYTLITLIIAGATLIMLLALTTIFGMSANDNPSTCAANVAVRAGIVASNSPQDAPLQGCTTEYKELKGNNQQVTRDLAQAYARCKTMFGPAANKQLSRDTATFCFVCGTYDITQAQYVTDLEEEITQLTQTNVFTQKLSQQDFPLTQELDTTQPVGVLFVQETDSQHGFVSSLLQGVGSRTPVLGAFVTASSTDIRSGIVISQYDQQNIQALGCTTTDPTLT